MIPNKTKSRDLIGATVRTTVALKTGGGILVPKGTVCNVRSVARGFTLTTEPCKTCGLSLYMTGVTRDEVELVPGTPPAAENH